MSNERKYIIEKMLSFKEQYNIASFKLKIDVEEATYTVETYPLFSENKQFIKDKFNMILDFFKAFDGTFLAFIEEYNFDRLGEGSEQYDLQTLEVHNNSYTQNYNALIKKSWNESSFNKSIDVFEILSEHLEKAQLHLQELDFQYLEDLLGDTHINPIEKNYPFEVAPVIFTSFNEKHVGNWEKYQIYTKKLTINQNFDIENEIEITNISELESQTEDAA